MLFVFNSYSTFQQSYHGYYMVVTYSAVLQCCSGYTGTPPNCQGRDQVVHGVDK